jgi:riboflavin synthase
VFTGIIESTAQVIERSENGLTLKRPACFDDIRIGSSICVSGVCLSIIEIDDKSMRFDVMQETWDRTKLGGLKKGDYVNLERALKTDGRFEGHIVQGHVDCVGEVKDVCRGATASRPGEAIMSINYPSDIKNLIVEKGSIAIDGISLTVTDVDDEAFSVSLIPLTLKETTLGSVKEGDSVNLEADILGKYMLKRA